MPARGQRMVPGSPRPPDIWCMFLLRVGDTVLGGSPAIKGREVRSSPEMEGEGPGADKRETSQKPREN